VRAAATALTVAACGHSPIAGGAPDAGRATIAAQAAAVRRDSPELRRDAREAVDASGESMLDASGAAMLRASGEAPSLVVGPAATRIHPTGRFDVGVWGGSVNTHTLLDATGAGAVPVSECRFLWGQGNLYAFFYAGDLDLEVRSTKHDGPVWKDDSVTFAFFPPAAGAAVRDASDAGADTKFVVSVTPTGVVSDGICPREAVDLGDPRCDLRWESGARVGTDFDGTINKLGDFDEEWAVEMALPVRSIGVDPTTLPHHLAATVRRCEMAHDGVRSCGLWGDPGRPGDLTLVAR
jgi:hypothetical protein